MKLTKPQEEMLAKLDKQGPQRHERGRAVRVQNSLRSKGLVRFTRDGKPFRPDVVEIMVSAGYGYINVMCEITDAGRAALAEVRP